VICTKVIKFCLPGLELSLEIVSNTEELITDPTDDDQIPYWAELWPAARGLAQYIWESVDFQGQTVLELGAGLGLPGLVAALKGGQVTLSDYKESALEIAARNAARNNIENVRCLLADWRDFQVEEKFDWIIGSDVLYNPSLNPYVATILENNLQPGGQLIFSHPGRKVTQEFLRELVERKGMVEKKDYIPVTVDHPVLPCYEIEIHHLISPT
jgi:predicted nicotinamide N-methyase